MNLKQVQALLTEMSKTLNLHVNAYSVTGSAVMLAHGLRQEVSNINLLVDWHGASVLNTAGLEMQYCTIKGLMVAQYGCITFALDAKGVDNAVLTPAFTAKGTSLEDLLAIKINSPLKKDIEDARALQPFVIGKSANLGKASI